MTDNSNRKRIKYLQHYLNSNKKSIDELYGDFVKKLFIRQSTRNLQLAGSWSKNGIRNIYVLVPNAPQRNPIRLEHLENVAKKLRDKNANNNVTKARTNILNKYLELMKKGNTQIYVPQVYSTTRTLHTLRQAFVNDGLDYNNTKSNLTF